ncbi:MAG: phosphatidylserine/phosphatidylglycerophosphate/cardiolipin synthase family protein [Deltaproteobacteria bacterium]|nr:phosphatidylserine/phosphatidylglycerophosphate/cardiolipin synthase family protein [Deltaproteobacteria bacterium]
MKKLLHAERFPWRDGNLAQLHGDGGSFFPAMLAAIATAREFVLLEMYLVESGRVADRFIDALLQAAERGVKVWVLFDAFGALGLTSHDAGRLSHANLTLAYFNPFRLQQFFHLDRLLRDHRKLLVVDGTRAFVGGTGLTDDFDPAVSPENHWRETMLEMTGLVVADWVESFRKVWRRATGAVLPLAPVQPAAAGQLRGRVAINSTLGHREIKRAFFIYARRAKKRVWLATPYFVPSGKIRRALRSAARNNVDVRVLLPGPCMDHPVLRQIGRRFYPRLLLSGVRIFEYQPRFLHYKAVLCDDWLSLGSSNFDRWNLRWNLEGNQEILDKDFAGRFATMFAADCEAAMEIRLADVARPGWPGRLRHWFWSRLDQLIARLSHGRFQRRDPFV